MDTLGIDCNGHMNQIDSQTTWPLRLEIHSSNYVFIAMQLFGKKYVVGHREGLGKPPIPRLLRLEGTRFMMMMMFMTSSVDVTLC